jgi:hypothetical protein
MGGGERYNHELRNVSQTQMDPYMFLLDTLRLIDGS